MRDHELLMGAEEEEQGYRNLSYKKRSEVTGRGGMRKKTFMREKRGPREQQWEALMRD